MRTIWRRAAACALALGLAGSLALAAPAAAQDDRFPAPGRELAIILCDLFGGIWFEYRDVGVWGCQFDGGDITCDGKECWIVLPLPITPLRDECDAAGGRYGELGPAAYTCEVKEGALGFDCTDGRQRLCDVGWAAARDPMLPPRR